MEKQTSDKIEYEWLIENYSMYHQSKKACLYSSDFVLNSLPGMKWCIIAYSKVNIDDVVVCLKRNDNIPETCKVNYVIQGVGCDGKLIFKHSETTFCTAQGTYGYLPFSRKTVFDKLVNDILILKCTLKPLVETKEQNALPPLTYNHSLFSDVVLCAGNESFHVHKAILSVRWPKLAKQLNAKKAREYVFDTRSDVLEAMIKYVYTGKIDCPSPEFSAELYACAVKYGLRSPSSVLVVVQKWRTRIQSDKVSFDWRIKNFATFPINTILHSPVFTSNIQQSVGWKLTLCIYEVCEDTMQSRSFDVFLSRICETEQNEIFVRTKIGFNGYCLTNKHLFKMKNCCMCSVFRRVTFTPPLSELVLKCEFMFSNGSHSSETVESSCVFASHVNCHFFSSDLGNLYKSRKLSDVVIAVKSKLLRAHKFILCSRSSVFSRMFQTEMCESKKNRVEITDIDSDIMDEMLFFMYSGYLKRPLDEKAFKLYAAADKYDISVLKEKCSSFLKSNLSVSNACSVLKVSDLHSDDDLYRSVLEFICAHEKSVFSTDEWKNTVKCMSKLAEKLLQDVVLKKI